VTLETEVKAFEAGDDSRVDSPTESLPNSSIYNSGTSNSGTYNSRTANGTEPRVGNLQQKIIPRKTELTEQMVISVGIPAVPRNRNSRNSVPNPSAEETTSRNSVPWNRNRSKLSEFPSEPFSG
jgi:hypothetical protein